MILVHGDPKTGFRVPWENQGMFFVFFAIGKKAIFELESRCPKILFFKIFNPKTPWALGKPGKNRGCRKNAIFGGSNPDLSFSVYFPLEHWDFYRKLLFISNFTSDFFDKSGTSAPWKPQWTGFISVKSIGISIENNFNIRVLHRTFSIKPERTSPENPSAQGQFLLRALGFSIEIGLITPVLFFGLFRGGFLRVFLENLIAMALFGLFWAIFAQFRLF